MQEVFGFVKRNLSEAQRRKDAPSGERGAAKLETLIVVGISILAVIDCDLHVVRFLMGKGRACGYFTIWARSFSFCVQNISKMSLLGIRS